MSYKINFTCQICFNGFDNEEYSPKVLGKCGHTICQTCLNTLIITTRKKNHGFKRWFLKCPFDFQDHLIKEETTIDDFPKNFVLSDLIQEKLKKGYLSILDSKKNIDVENLKKKEIFEISLEEIPEINNDYKHMDNEKKKFESNDFSRNKKGFVNCGFNKNYDFEKKKKNELKKQNKFEISPTFEKESKNFKKYTKKQERIYNENFIPMKEISDKLNLSEKSKSEDEVFRNLKNEKIINNHSKNYKIPIIDKTIKNKNFYATKRKIKEKLNENLKSLKKKDFNKNLNKIIEEKKNIFVIIEKA